MISYAASWEPSDHPAQSSLVTGLDCTLWNLAHQPHLTRRRASARHGAQERDTRIRLGIEAMTQVDRLETNERSDVWPVDVSG